MKPETLQVLQESIAHWKRMKSRTLEEWKNFGRSPQSPYGQYCPLCKLHRRHECRGCPVKKRTRKTGCVGSPWKEAKSSYELLAFARLLCGGQRYNEYIQTCYDTWQVAAQQEIDFLESLLPK